MRSAAARTTLFVLSLLVFGLAAGLGGYYAGGRSDAIEDARPLTRLADRLLARGRDGPGLGVGREAILLAALTPAASGDRRGPESALPIVTQSLAERLASERSSGGLGRIRRDGYASGLETTLSRTHLIALWLETVEMGRGPHGWLRGIYATSKALYGRKPDQLTDDEFRHLVSLAIPHREAPRGETRG